MTTVLIATDADWVARDIAGALDDTDTSVERVRSGHEVLDAVRRLDPDLIVLDLQIGNMGGMATCMALRGEEGAGRVDLGPILMLLDRNADTFLARRSDADGWMVKPLDAVRIRAAARALLDNGHYVEGTSRSLGA